MIDRLISRKCVDFNSVLKINVFFEILYQHLDLGEGSLTMIVCHAQGHQGILPEVFRIYIVLLLRPKLNFESSQPFYKCKFMES